MIKLFYDAVRAFLWDAKSAQASLRSLLTLIAASASVVVASASDAAGNVNIDIIRAWDWKAWAIRLGIAFVGAAALRIKAGDKNDSPDAIVAKLQAAGYKVEKLP